ncbi:cupin domain-containing protein [Duganella sp. CT11-25]|jgi:quercetin dioxygenase-like cupin family protein|uniref:cupin domain-containing protein n=1 Tax=unclassified Duganella TaxID=2636909 RepID=UPI0039B0ED66
MTTSKQHDKSTFVAAAIALLLGGVLATQAAQAEAPKAAVAGIGRTEALRHDFGDAGREVVQVRVDFAPGASFPKHTHPGEEIAYVLEGAVEYQLGDQPPVMLKAGDALFIPAGAVHSARNLGSVHAAELATYVIEKGKPSVVIVTK